MTCRSGFTASELASEQAAACYPHSIAAQVKLCFYHESAFASAARPEPFIPLVIPPRAYSKCGFQAILFSFADCSMGNDLIQIGTVHADGSDAVVAPHFAPVSAGPGEGKTFYIETFGCQMNVHDSEKVAGVLMARGYRPVETHEDAEIILYNTCSIREKAAQKVFSRIGAFRKTGSSDQIIAVLGCVAQQEGEK